MFYCLLLAPSSSPHLVSLSVFVCYLYYPPSHRQCTQAKHKLKTLLVSLPDAKTFGAGQSILKGLRATYRVSWYTHCLQLAMLDIYFLDNRETLFHLR